MVMLATTLYAADDSFLWEGSQQHRMRNDGTIEITQDYGSYETRTYSNGQQQMIFKNTFDSDMQKIKERKEQQDQQEEIKKLRKKLYQTDLSD